MSLLPENYKKAIRSEKVLRLAAAFLVLLSLVLLTAFVLMLPSYFSLVFSKDAVLRRQKTEEEVLARREIGKLEGEIKRVNGEIAFYERNESARHSLSHIFLKVLNNTPPSIKISNLDLSKGDGAQYILSLAGKADTRDNFLKYVTQLESISDFAEVVSPISNLLKETDTPFTLSIKIKPEAYSYEAN